jgi:hypothetical protein
MRTKNRGHGIFDRIRLRPEQARTVAEQRFGDAEALRRTGRNARANGAMYLGGFVVECLLKAQLLERFPWLQSTGSPDSLGRTQQRLWSLCYRSHDLDEILGRLPEVTRRLAALEQRGHSRLLQGLKSVCGQWTVFARYSPRSATMAEASAFLDRIQEPRQWLR